MTDTEIKKALECCSEANNCGQCEYEPMGKVYDGIMGLVVGDALGVPFEFKQRNTFKCTDMIGFGTYNQPAGTWSDDSSMTLATVDSIIKCEGQLNQYDIMHRFKQWLQESRYTPHGEVFDVGRTTQQAIYRYINRTPIALCGGSDVMDNGNGSLMRILPLAFIDCSVSDIKNISALTHAHIISLDACVVYLMIARNLLKGEPIEKAVEIFKPLKNRKRNEIKGSGYVLDTLEAALWCLLNTENYKDCVLTAVNLGGDTDTIAAVAGGLAGIYYGVGGENGIPEEWIEQIARKDWIEKLCERLERLR